MNAVEMRMIRWTCRVTRRDKIRNKLKRRALMATEISSKMQERRLNWHGHVMRRDENYLGRRAMAVEISGRGRKG